jgi:hypothetical protein
MWCGVEIDAACRPDCADSEEGACCDEERGDHEEDDFDDTTAEDL